MLATAGISRNQTLLSLGFFTLCVTLGLAIVNDAGSAAAFTGLALVVPVLLRYPEGGSVLILAFALAQPLLLRYVPEINPLWIWLKRADEVLLVAVMPLALLCYFGSGARFFPRKCLLCLLGVFAIGAIGSALRRPPWDMALLDGFLLLKGFLFAFIASSLCPSRKQLGWLFRSLVGFAIAAGVFGLIELAFPQRIRAVLPLVSAGYRLGRACIVSVFHNEGEAGWFFGFMAAACYAFFLVYRRKSYFALFGLFSTFALLSLRRKPMGGLLIVLLLSLLLSRGCAQRWKRLAVVALVIVIPFVVMGDVLGPIMAEGYDVYVAPRDAMVIARNAMYIASFRIAMDLLPVGVGFGLFGGYASQLSYSPVYIEYGLSKTWGLTPQYSGYATDAYWPHILGQFGFLGLLLFLAALGSLWMVPLRTVRRDADPWRRAVSLAAIFTFVEALAESMAAPLFETTLSACFVFGLAGVALRLGSSPVATADPLPVERE